MRAGTEFEMRFLIDRRGNKNADVHAHYRNEADTIQIAEFLMEKYKDKPQTQEKSMNWIYDEKGESFICKNIYDKAGKRIAREFYKKKKLLAPLFFISRDEKYPSYKCGVSHEEKLSKPFDLKQCKKIRLKFRNSIQLTNWRIDITIVREITDLSNTTTIEQFRNNMFVPRGDSAEMRSMPWQTGAHIEIELEFTSDLKTMDLQHLKAARSIWKGLIAHDDGGKVDEIYQSLIYRCATYIKPFMAKRFRGQYGIKQLGNQVMELDRNIYVSAVAPTIDNYYFTDKIDGERTIIFIVDDIVVALNRTYKLITQDLVSESTDVEKLKERLRDKTATVYVFDTEAYKENYYLFDVMVWEGKLVLNQPFEERMKYFEKAAAAYSFIKNKPFYKLRDMAERPNEQLETDGYILTPADGKYNEMIVYKLKPLDKLTIDFYLVDCPQKMLGIKPFVKNYDEHSRQLYILTCGIERRAQEHLRMRVLNGIEIRSSKYNPIQFEPSDYSYAYIFWGEKGLAGRVGEFRLRAEVLSRVTDPKYFVKVMDAALYKNENIWELVRIREDRDVEIARGAFFGNNYKVAETIWQNYHAPITIEDMRAGAITSYFQESDSDAHKNTRAYNSYVKSRIFESLTGTQWVLDMAAGKGQDFFRYSSAQVQNLTALEIDVVAIQEFIARKHQFAAKDYYPMSVRAITVDLNDSYIENREKINITRFNYPNEGFNVIVCNLAFHYFLANKAAVANIAKFIAEQLRDQGRFIMTCFDGAAVCDLIATEDWDVGDYAIRAASLSETKQGAEHRAEHRARRKKLELKQYGQEIEVKLPFSGGQFYTEYLVNIDYIEQEFAHHNLILEKDVSFGEFMDEYDKAVHMTADEKKYVALYHYYAFYKNTHHLNDVQHRVVANQKPKS